MFLASLLRRIAFSYYDYKAYNFNIEKTDFVVIHIPDQIGDAMAIFPVIRALELHKIKHLLIVTSTINLEVFNALKLEKTKLTLVTMTMQDHATLKEIKDLAKNITQQYGTPDLCIEAMRKKNLKTMIFISQLKAKTNFQVVDLTMKCYSPLCKNASRMDQNLRAPVPMTWAFMMREAGFPAVRPIYELPLSEDVLDEVREEMRSLGSYIALNLEGSSQERTFSLSIAENLIAKIQSETDIPIVIVHGPKGEDKARVLVDCYNNVAIPVELSHDDKKKLVAEYCQKNFVDKGMIADIAFHDLDSKNPHAHVMLTLKTIGPEGFGKKDRSWNDKKIMIQWRESWATMSNSYLEAAGSEERIDHRSLRTQCADALAQAEEAFSAEEKAFWLAKATETNRPAMQRVHRAKWNDKESQEQRATEQAQRDHQIEEAKKVYTTFSELPLEIVVDVRSFTITHLADPEEIVLPDYPATVEQQSIVATATTSRRPPVKSYRDPNKVSKVNVSGKKSPVLVAPEPTASTKLKTPYLQNTRAMNRAPVRSRKQTKPRQNGLFKRFTLLIVDFLKERFVWAKRKPDTTDADHDKRIAENYVYDEVLGVNVPRSEFEKRTKFNNGDYKLTSDEIKRFPSRPNQEQPEVNRSLDLTPSMPPEHMRQGSAPKLSPP
ncbi:MobA/MobL family protein [Escherichia coli]|nr:MobA/MobL family protein [Escherichia coli]EES7833395.1 MobA/MobL family protein [Escherichia coli]EEU4059966.1 MobA/MobL family protein [Escherichia coli]EEX6775784.1 MobA/MobL family protein [Escherichia coli]EEX9402079.1 MobA/MobL family protein [Escherichia coli]